MTPAMTTAPLAGLRVLETAVGIAGPYAGRLLAMLGATVIKVEPANGDPARLQQVDDEPLVGTSPLFVHLNAGKANASRVDRDWAHVVIEDRVRADLDPGELVDGPPIVSVTAWGIDADSPGTISDELLVQAASGFIGFNRDPDDAPLRLPGWPAQYMAGAHAAIGAMTTLRGDAQHVEVSWLASFMGSVELAYADALHCERPRTPVGAHPPTAFPSGAIACKDGFVAPGSIRAIDWEMQCLFYERPDLIEDRNYSSRQRRAERIDELREIIEPWYAERTKREIFQLALDTPWAVGMIMTPTDVAEDPHLVARDFLVEIETPEGPTKAPQSVWKMPGLPVRSQRLEAQAETRDIDPESDGAPEPFDLPGLAGHRVIEMTTAWAGPYVGNLLSPLGVDVIKVEAQAPFDGWRALRPYDHGMRPGQEDLVADNRFFNASGLYNSLNRGKRACALNLRTEEGRELFGELVRSSDGIVANFSAEVLPSLGFDFETLRALNPGIVVVRMPAFGTTGPYSGAVGYGSILEAMGGIGHRQGYAHEQARISNIYYPDPVAGVHAATALLGGWHRRDVTGEGCEIDMSHQEATWMLHGDSLVLADQQGRDVGRMGSQEPGIGFSGIMATADSRWLAVVGSASCSAVAFDELDLEAGVEQVTAAGGNAVEVLDPWTAPDSAPVADLLETVDHPITGPVRHVAGPFIFDGTRPATVSPAPLFDQHTDEVLTELAGRSPEELAHLRSIEAIGGELPTPADIGIRF